MYIFAKFIYNEYIRSYFLLHVIYTIFASAPPPRVHWCAMPIHNLLPMLKILESLNRDCVDIW
jgi:hypothetical protein